jgi:hypothetical protein
VFSSDGARLLAGSHTGLKLLDVASGEIVRDLRTDSARQAVFSADGSRFVSVGWNGTIKQWDEIDGALVQSFETQLRNSDSGKPGSPRNERRSMQALELSSDGAWLLSKPGYDDPLEVWNAATGQKVQTLQGRPTNFLRSAAFSPDGTRLVSGHTDGSAKLWDLASARVIRSVWHAKSVDAVAFSHDGSRLLTGGEDSVVKLWDTATGKLIRTFQGHSSSVTSVAFAPDEKRIISGSYDTTARVWDAATGELLALLLATDQDEWLAITPEGFFDASPKGAQMLTIARGFEVFGIDQFYQALYRPDLVREKLAGDPNGKVKNAAAKLDLAKLVESGRAPSVAITSHRPNDESPADLVTVEASIADQGGGIGHAEWRINGIVLGIVDQLAATGGRPVTLKQTMALDPGDNTVELVAFNRANLVASVPARVTISWTGSEPTVPPRLYVLAVGINDYLDAELKLTYAAPDARTLADAIKQAGQGFYEDVVVTQILDQDATATRLDDVFTDLAAKIRPRDLFVFFAAGHGKTLDGRYYFIPYDLRYQTEKSLVRDAIGQEKLQSWFARIQAKKAVLMFDTCEAGSLTERAPTRGGLEQKAALGRLIQATGRATLTASSATQEAYEGYGGHGVFTFALLDALAHGDADNNGLVELAELIQYVDGLVPAITAKQWGAKQFPQMDAYGSNFPLVRQVASLAPNPGDAIVIPVKPTHVSTELLQIFKEAAGGDTPLQQLPPFTPVTLVKSDRGWGLVARDGKLLGYAAEAKLHKLN